MHGLNLTRSYLKVLGRAHLYGLQERWTRWCKGLFMLSWKNSELLHIIFWGSKYFAVSLSLCTSTISSFQWFQQLLMTEVKNSKTSYIKDQYTELIVYIFLAKSEWIPSYHSCQSNKKHWAIERCKYRIDLISPCIFLSSCRIGKQF